MKRTLLIASLGFTLAHSLTAADTASIFDIRNEVAFKDAVDTTAPLKKLATDLSFTEGPQWFKDNGGYLIFSDIPGNHLMKWTAKEGATIYRSDSQNANGNTIDLEGRLVSAEHSGRRVSMTEKDGTIKTLVDSFEGKKLNSPNDPVVKSDGSIYFTDPDYGLKGKPGTKEKEGKELPGDYVFRFEPKTKKLTLIAKDLDKPNGLCFSPDEKKLYIADSGAPRNIRVYEVKADGTLGEGKEFCKIDKGGPDGIRCDKAGRIWSSAGDGVHIFAPSGELIGKILVPEGPANVGFGGKDLKTLFITARKSLYAIDVKAQGIK